MQWEALQKSIMNLKVRTINKKSLSSGARPHGYFLQNIIEYFGGKPFYVPWVQHLSFDWFVPNSCHNCGRGMLLLSRVSILQWERKK